MGKQYDGFRANAVKQAIDRGHFVNGASKCLGLSAQSLYKWVKAVSPTKKNELEREASEVWQESSPQNGA